MKQILKNSFWQLITIYTAIVVLIALGFLSKYSIQFNILAIIIGIIGAFSLNKEKDIKLNKKFHYILLAIGIILILILRIIPYLNNSIPLGYDPGLYKYGIEHGLENKDLWILQGGMEPGFLYAMQAFTLLFSTEFILKYLLIGFCIMLGLAIYFVSKEYFNKTTALISVFIYAFSLIQFKAFWFMYYKNIVGMSLMLFSFYFLRKYQNTQNKTFSWLFIILAGLTGAIHRPTFYILGLSYFIYAFISPYSAKRYNCRLLLRNILFGIAIITIAGIFYIGDFFPAITNVLPWVAHGFISPGESPGTFINFFTYQYSILPYFIFAVLGLIFSLRKKLGILEIWAILNLSIVYFQF
ncbi:MAG: glycosyltransferase family 39 protein, partial [archaeon]|nr:glycosyltransferase family 39 protein [archaeon]